MEQGVDLGHGPGSLGGLAGRGETAHAVQGNHHEIEKGEGVDLQFLDDEGRGRIGGREMVADLDAGREAFDELLVHDDPFPASRLSGQDLVGHGPPEQLEKGFAVVERRGGRDDAPVGAEIVGQQFRVRAAHAGGQDHAELARGAQADDEFVAKAVRVRGQVLDHEHAPDVLGHGRDQGVPAQALVPAWGVAGMALDAVGVALGHFVQHAPAGGTDLVRLLGNDAHPADVALVHDIWGHDLEHDLLAGQGQQLLVRGAGSDREQDAARRSLGAKLPEQGVHFVLEQELPALAGGGLEDPGHGREIDMGGDFGVWCHGCFPVNLVVFGPEAVLDGRAEIRGLG